MLSQPNIPFADFKRLTIDDTSPVRIRFWDQGTAMDLTGRAFRIVIYGSSTATPALTLEDSSIDRPEGAAAGLLQWNAENDRDTLNSKAAYTGYLFEINNGKREPRLWFRFQWLSEPPGYSAGLPVEPPEVALNYDALPPIAEDVPVYGSASQPNFATVEDARNASLPNGRPMFITLEGQPGWKDADDVYFLLLTPA